MHKKWEYYRQINGNITICELYSESKCEKNQTGLNKNDFIINSNLSLYQKDTGILYELGKYDVVNKSIALCNLEQFNVPTCSSKNSCKGRCTNYTHNGKLKPKCAVHVILIAMKFSMTVARIIPSTVELRNQRKR